MKRPGAVMSSLRTLWRAFGASWKRLEPVLDRFRTLLRRLGGAVKRLGSVSDEFAAVFERLRAILTCLVARLRRLGRVLKLWSRFRSCKNNDFAAYIYQKPWLTILKHLPTACWRCLHASWSCGDPSWDALESSWHVLEAS